MEPVSKTLLPEKLNIAFRSFGELSFTYLEEITDFIQSERQGWEPVTRSAGSEGRHLSTGASLIGNQLNQVERSINEYRQATSMPEDSANRANAIAAHFGQLKTRMYELQNPTYLTAKSSLAKRIIEKSADDAKLAHLALTFSVAPKDQTQLNSYLHVDARLIAKAVIFLGSPVNQKEYEDSLSEMQLSWSKRLAAEQSLFQEAISDAKAQTRMVQGQILQKQEELDQLKNECAQQVIAHGETLARLQNQFREDMLLKAPAEYWQHKYEGHRDWAIWCLLLMIATVAGILYGSYALAPWIIDQVSKIRDGNSTGWVGEIALVTVPAIAAFWLLKAVSRLFVQQTQRMGDALERNTMVKTYLALLTEAAHKAEPSERLVILQALFRPGPDDPPDTEGSAGMLEALSKMTR